MKKPFLRNQIRKQLEMSINTDEAAEALREMGATVDSRNPDAMPFEIAGEDYRIEGLIERWQGTESRLRFEGEITIAPFDQTLRNRIVAVSAVLVLLITNYVILPWSMDIFGTSGIFRFYVVYCVYALLIVFVLMFGIFRLASFDPLAERRWNAQQRLGEFAEDVENLKFVGESGEEADKSPKQKRLG